MRRHWLTSEDHSQPEIDSAFGDETEEMRNHHIMCTIDLFSNLPPSQEDEKDAKIMMSTYWCGTSIATTLEPSFDLFLDELGNITRSTRIGLKLGSSEANVGCIVDDMKRACPRCKVSQMRKVLTISNLTSEEELETTLRTALRHAESIRQNILESAECEEDYMCEAEHHVVYYI